MTLIEEIALQSGQALQSVLFGLGRTAAQDTACLLNWSVGDEVESVQTYWAGVPGNMAPRIMVQQVSHWQQRHSRLINATCKPVVYW